MLVLGMVTDLVAAVEELAPLLWCLGVGSVWGWVRIALSPGLAWPRMSVAGSSEKLLAPGAGGWHLPVPARWMGLAWRPVAG